LTLRVPETPTSRRLGRYWVAAAGGLPGASAWGYPKLNPAVKWRDLAGSGVGGIELVQASEYCVSEIGLTAHVR
jgi:hypothetical protein